MPKIIPLILVAFVFYEALSQNIILRNPGCNAYDEKGVCKSCSSRFYRAQNNICQPVNPNCRTYDQINGNCLSCYPGFGLLQGTCLPGFEDSASLDPNCNQFNNNVCVKCSFGYYFDQDGKCAKADPNCLTFNQKNGDCLSCYPSYALLSGKCIREVAKPIDPNCNQFDSKNICVKCSQGYFFQEGACTKIDDSCKSYDVQKNICKECYPGYILNLESKCVSQTPKENPNILCAEWNGSLCIKCAKGSTFDKNGMCLVQDAYCRTYDAVTNQCKRCYTGYALLNEVCQLEKQKQVSDLNCNSFGSNGVCSRCSVGFFLNEAKKCTKIDDSCKSFSIVNKRCMGCYSGYQLSLSGECVRAIQQVTDLNCAQWNGTICQKCSIGATFDLAGLCVLIDTQCREYDQNTKKCKSCYPGYELNSDKCVQSQILNVRDPLCAEWNSDFCIRCAFGSFFNPNGICSQADSSCKTFDQITGKCSSCYSGYTLSNNGICVKTADKENNNPQCAEWDKNGELCLRCAVGSFFNRLGFCELVNPLCKTFDALNGACTSCFNGYQVNPEGQCQKSKESEKDPFCAEFQDEFCVKCSSGYYFESDGKCTAADPLCATFDLMNGKCLTCFIGYEVKSGLCIPKQENARDPNCAFFNPDNTCKQCSKSFIFNQNTRNCQLTNPLCRTIDQAGACTSCYGGYVIKGTTCEQDQNAESSFCAQLIDNICIRCASRTFLNSIGECEKVSEDCRTYNDFDGNCLSCYSGYALQKGKCFKDQVKGGCAQFDSNGKCRKCSSGFYLSNSECIQLDAQCAKFNFEKKICQGCYTGYTLLEGRCEIQKVEEQYEVKNCVAYNTEQRCIQCFERFYLTNNQCKQVSVFCKTYDLISGACTGCYSNFKLRNGQCSK